MTQGFSHVSIITGLNTHTHTHSTYVLFPLTVRGGSAAVVDLCDLFELGSFLDVSQQGISSAASSCGLEFRRFRRKLEEEKK